MSYDPQYGARPVNRFLQKYVLNELSKKILAGEVSVEHPIQVVLKDDELQFKTQKKSEDVY